METVWGGGGGRQCIRMQYYSIDFEVTTPILQTQTDRQMNGHEQPSANRGYVV